MIRRLLLAVALAALAGCLGVGGSPSGGLSGDLAATRAEYLVLDLVTGVAATAGSVDDLAGDPALRDRYMVFRRVPGGAAGIGSPADEAARQDDEVRRQATVAPCYLAVFECTQAQWTRLAASAPWQGCGFPTGDAEPAYGLSATMAAAGIALANPRLHGGRLALPTGDEWEHACRAGSAAAYSWGAGSSAAAAAAHAVVAETRSGDGPLPVGGRAANAYGLYDMHGNVWELTAEGDLRGGSWLDPVSLARSANRQEIEPDTALPIAGVRLCWRPGR